LPGQNFLTFAKFINYKNQLGKVYWVCFGPESCFILSRVPWSHWAAFSFITIVRDWGNKLSCYQCL